ncbi:MAG: hypothetical protein ACREUM_09135 [Nitrosospira sp.]
MCAPREHEFGRDIPTLPDPRFASISVRRSGASHSRALPQYSHLLQNP